MLFWPGNCKTGTAKWRVINSNIAFVRIYKPFSNCQPQTASGAQKGHFTRVDIDNLLQDVVEFYKPLVEDKEISILFDKKD